jgi:hypothetical protein
MWSGGGSTLGLTLATIIYLFSGRGDQYNSKTICTEVLPCHMRGLHGGCHGASEVESRSTRDLLQKAFTGQCGLFCSDLQGKQLGLKERDLFCMSRRPVLFKYAVEVGE